MQQENEDVENELFEIELNEQVEISCEGDDNQNNQNYSETVLPQLHATLYSVSEINDKVRSLNLKQRQIFDFLYNWAKLHVKAKLRNVSKQSRRPVSAN